MSRRAKGINRFSVASLLASAVLAAAGCGMQQHTRTGGPGVDPRDAIRAKTYPALHETIGEYATVANLAPTIVEGIGMVAALPNTGSSDMPPNVREMLLDNLYNTMHAGSYIQGTQNISPERILASGQVAAVEIRGIIPALARRGSTFDVMVASLPNTGTTSLANGLLWTTELKLAGTAMESHSIALARGPVFIPGAVEGAAGSSPAGNVPDIATRKVLRSGRVVGGGIVTEERPIQLQLYSPGLGKAQVLERAINAKFPGIDKAASADNDSTITLTVPPNYTTRPAEFIDLIKHIYLRQDVPGFNQQKAAELIRDLADPHAPHRDLSIALQTLGRSVLPDFIEPQYKSSNPLVRFWCAHAGAAMQDVGGMVILQEFVRDTASPFHQEAVEAVATLSHGDTVRATLALADLLKSPKPEERIRAYEALSAIGSRAVRHYAVGTNFYLDVLPSDSPSLIYVSQSGAQRIALIGRPIVLPPGALYISPDNQLTVNVMPEPAGRAAAPTAPTPVVTASVAGSDASDASPASPATAATNVMLLWRSPLTGKTSKLSTGSDISQILARLGWAPNPRSPDYDPAAPFIGASYQRIVEMLDTMVDNQLIDAKFIMQKSSPLPISAIDLVTEGRPEGSTALPPAATAPGVVPTPRTDNGAIDTAPLPMEAPVMNPGPSLAPLPHGN